MVYSVFPFDEQARKLLHLAKFRGRTEYLDWLLSGLCDGDFPYCTQKALVPVPLHIEKFMSRGFNSAFWIVKRLHALTGASMELTTLTKIRKTEPQSSLARDRRLTNLRGAFRYDSKSNHDLILVDDILTTGSTLLSCRKAIRRTSRERKVLLWTLFRVD